MHYYNEIIPLSSIKLQLTSEQLIRVSKRQRENWNRKREGFSWYMVCSHARLRLYTFHGVLWEKPASTTISTPFIHPYLFVSPFHFNLYHFIIKIVGSIQITEMTLCNHKNISLVGKENNQFSTDKMLLSKHSNQYSQQSQYTPWSVTFLSNLKTPLARLSTNEIEPYDLQRMGHTFGRRKHLNRSTQLRNSTIAQELKKQAQYLDCEIPDFYNSELKFPSEYESEKLSNAKATSSVKSNNFVFNIIQQKKQIPKREYFKKYTRLHNQSLQSYDYESISSKETIIFNKINRKGTQNTSRPRKKLATSFRWGSTDQMPTQKVESKSPDNRIFTNFNKLIRGRKLKMLKSKTNQLQ